MVTRTKSFLLMVAVAVTVTGIAWGQTKSQKANTKKLVVSKSAASTVKPLTVNDLAAKPSDHLGRTAVVGVVATVTEKKGFLLIDTREYKACGLSCLTEAGTKKIPVRWSGAAPKVKDTVRVEGTMAKEAKGFSFTAEKIGKP